MIIGLGSATWPAADDFAVTVHKREVRPWANFVWTFYFKRLDGRLLGTALFGTLINQAESLNLIVSAIVVFFLIALFLFIKMWMSICFPEKPGGQLYPFITIISCFWLGWRSMFADTLYWAMGAVQYALVTFFVMLWLYGFFIFAHKDMAKKKTLFALLPFFTLSFLAGTGNQTFSPAAILIGFVTIFFTCSRPENRKVLIISLSLFMLGAFAMYIAPSNFRRASWGNGSFELNPIKMALTYFTGLGYFIIENKFFLALNFAGAACSAAYFTLETKNARPSLPGNGPAVIVRNKWALILAFLCGALAAILPLSLLPDFFYNRSGFFHLLLLVFFIWIFTGHSVRVFARRITAVLSHSVLIVKALPILLGITLITITSTDIFFGSAIRRQMMKRHTALSDIPETIKRAPVMVKLDRMSGHVPEILHFDDVKEYCNFWTNEFLAKYYGVTLIFLKKPGKDTEHGRVLNRKMKYIMYT